MKYRLLFLLMFAAASTQAQTLQNINYSYIYNPESDIAFQIKPVKFRDAWVIFYQLTLNDTTYAMDDYAIEWEERSNVSDKQGNAISPESTELTILKSEKNYQTGKFTIGLSADSQIIVARVTNKTSKQATFFFEVLSPNYPVNAYLKNAVGQVVFTPYVNKEHTLTIQSELPDESFIISYYHDFFPTAAPAFSEGLAKVSKGIKADSVFITTSNQPVLFKKPGLYLLQKDTSSIQGIAFRIEEDSYPKFNRVQDLVGPFIYICTRQEFADLRLTGSNKKEFDREVLAITHDKERARNFMRAYFQRVEAANHFFSSYKEGWKTDRGMIYIIYGLPEKVFKFTDREVWTYGKTNFTFVKSSTLFDPDNFVLIRNRKYTEDWYEQVDLVRNSRF